MNPETSPKQQLLVWWVLWLAFLVGSVVEYQFLSHPVSGNATSPLPWELALIPLLAGTAIRWGLLPRLKDATKALPFFVVGIALCEATLFFGIFIFSAQQRDLAILAFLGIAQFAPVFASKYFGGDDEPR